MVQLRDDVGTKRFDGSNRRGSSRETAGDRELDFDTELDFDFDCDFDAWSSGERMTRHLGSLLALVGAASVLGCGSAGPRDARSSSSTRPVATHGEDGKKSGWTLHAPKSRVLPDVVGPEGLLGGVLAKPSQSGGLSAPGEQRILGRMRIVTREGGIIDRANDLLPAGRVSAVELPTRLGGGFVFTLVNGRGTQLWRAKSWLDKLVPLVEYSKIADGDGPLVVGFDRLYLRIKSDNEVVAIDPVSGHAMSPGPLPVASSFGDMVFVDGWRAVVETDLRGVLATFDAGATWHRLAIKERVKSIGQDAGDPTISVEGGEYRLSATGQLSFSAASKPPTGISPITAEALRLGENRPRPPSPLGKRPLRAALEDGYSDTDRSAIVLRGGALGRVSLANGAVLALKEHAVPETASCHGIRLGPSFGFVCGEPAGATTLYEFVAPLGLKEVMRFDEPRFVTESGQGAIVVAGSCAAKTEPDDAAPKNDKNVSRSFCIRSAAGIAREIRVRGDLGAERVVAMSDGRVVVLVPPRPGAMGQVSIIDGSSAKHIALKMPAEGPLRELETGMWLEGFQESGSNEIGGWVEAGGPVVGIRVKLDGTVTAGQVVEEDGGVLVSGPFGLAVGSRGRALETVDGGLSWRDIDLPVLDGATPQTDERTRRCGPVGCALAGILRVGWGEPVVADDLAEAPDPPPINVPPLTKLASAPLALHCAPAVALKTPTPSRTSPSSAARPPKAAPTPATPTPTPKPKARPQKTPPPPPPSRRPPSDSSSTPGGWSAFRGVDAPTLAADEIGLDNGSPFELTPVRAYVWGKRDSDWTRTGRFVVRFGDRFGEGEVRSSAVTGSLWADEAAASSELGVGGYGVTWGAVADPSGTSAIVSACRGPCSLYAVEEDRPVLPLRGGRDINQLKRPSAGNAVRVGESWFYLTDGSTADRLSLYRADLGTVRLVAELPRPHGPRYVSSAAPRLVRRALGSGLGLYITTREFMDRKGTRWVLPIDPDTGALGDPIDLGRNDLASSPPSACDAARDGWLVVLSANEPPADVSSGGARVAVDGIELRLRLDTGWSCIEAAASTSDREPPATKGASDKATGPTFPLVLSERATSKRYSLACSSK